jgi:hypothetical protein
MGLRGCSCTNRGDCVVTTWLASGYSFEVTCSVTVYSSYYKKSKCHIHASDIRVPPGRNQNTNPNALSEIASVAVYLFQHSPASRIQSAVW